MDRRSFMGSILALAAAPAIVRADSLMRAIPRGVIVSTLDVYEEGEMVLNEMRGRYTRIGNIVTFNGIAPGGRMISMTGRVRGGPLHG